MVERRLPGLILVLFVLLGWSYALITPVFEASDELWHYPLVRHLADGNPLPVQDPANVGPWKQQASQPPLYYYLMAALTWPIDTGDMTAVRRLNLHVDNGVITADGNINLVVHDPAADPWQGTLLAVRVIRLISVLLGGASVYLTYLLAREVAPRRPELVWGATAVHAFLPMFLFISGAVNNDNLVIPLVALALLLIIRIVKSGAEPRRWRLLGLGAVIGLAALAKYPGLALLPMAFGGLFMLGWKRAPRTAADLPATLGRILVLALGQTAVVALPAALIAGWWYWRNRVLYGDWLGWSAFFEVLGVRATPAPLAQLWDERWGFMASFWGLFGGVNVPLPEWVYALLNGVAIVAVPGFVFYVAREVGRQRPFPARPTALLMRLLDLGVAYFPLLVCLIWSAATVIGLIRWATVTWSSQGRLVFAALGPLLILLVLGLVGGLPRRVARWPLAALATFLFAVSALTPWLVIRPAYDVNGYDPAVIFTRDTDITYGDVIRLHAFGTRPEALRPGEAVQVLLEWEVLRPVGRDWSIFVHLNDPVLGAPVAQRDRYPRQGLRTWTMLLPGERFADYFVIRLPETAVAPATLELVVGLYDFTTGERLSLATGADAATLSQLRLEPRPGRVPNPVAVNFEDELRLTGFSLPERRAAPGDTLELTLYWEAPAGTAIDYTFFAQVVDADTTRWAASDVAPLAGTATWPAGETRPVTLALPLRLETPPGLYPLIVGAYTRTADGGFDRLQTMTADGRLTDDFLLLTPVRVAE